MGRRQAWKMPPVHFSIADDGAPAAVALKYYKVPMKLEADISKFMFRLKNTKSAGTS